ncbi:ABC transporter ATP-binding protein [bacterium]|nr:ABC transporter ATP-binding protein [bacterium]
MTMPLLSLDNVSKRFVKPLDITERLLAKLGANLKDEVIHAVDHVSFDVNEKEVVGLVGESGCGKSTLGRVIAGIHKQSTGSVSYKGENVDKMTARQKHEVNLAIQMIFQDPFASLNPRKKVREIIGEAPLVHGLVSKNRLDYYVDELLERVGLDSSYKHRYPHQFSGGQRQRIGIARALAVQPDFLVCDESVAALDVSIQAQILNLFIDLKDELGLTYLFISHDLGVVEHLSDRVAIMYLGRIVEMASTEAIFEKPNHPYTKALLAEVPRLENRHKDFVGIKGEIPSPINPPSGCHFHPRCLHAKPECSQVEPKLKTITKDWLSACHLNDGVIDD